jgi:hypothetical protein
MSQMTEVRLDAPDVEQYSVQGSTIWVKTANYETFVRVPKPVRATLWTYGERSVLHAGSVKVSGPADQILTLWDALRS